MVLLAACTGNSADPTPGGETTAGTVGVRVIEEFAAAWPRADADTLRGIVKQPAVAAHDIAAHMAELGITQTQVTPDGEPECGDDSCRERAKVTHQLEGAGTWSYETQIKSHLDQGQWLVEWTAGTFHPDLTELTTLVRHRTAPPRAPILDRNGVALTPEREILRVGVVPRDVRRRMYIRLADLLRV
ncbi:MAG: NTF2-like N-terminal transpeptidase domain-containing protein, partial [Nocardioidaceae bacterium]